MKIRVYTDGACSENPGPGGWAAVFCLEDGYESLVGNEPSTTNNRMELMAVIKAMEKIAKDKAGQIYEIYSDSAYVVNSINREWLVRWKMNEWQTKTGEDVKNRDLWEQYWKVSVQARNNNQTVRFIKIKGHAGNTYNELCDRLAKEQVQLIKR